MIVKHVAMKAVRKSNFGELARYLSDPQERNERIGDIRIANCHADELADAVLEVMATQARNTRAEGDKTYHLIISFHAGEQPPDTVLAEIERRICVGLGFGEHQRISAVHHDTDNLHVHVAISKIHPTRLTMHEPFRAYRTLVGLCTALEAEYGLEPDNHQARKRGAENRAADMEHAAGVESLLGWVKRECLPQIQGAASWMALHQVMHDNGLMLRERGNGLVIEAGDGTMVKASSVSRDLSKSKLEARLGMFRLAVGHADQVEPTRRYEARPVRARIDTSALYARYKTEQQAIADSRSFELLTVRERKAREIDAAKRAGKLKRAAIKLMGGPGVSKKLLYALASKALHHRIQEIHAQRRKDSQAIRQRSQRHTWNDWLQHQAKAGDQQALAALRAREAAQGLKGNTVAGQYRRSNAPLATPEHITKQGTLIYRVGNTAIRDDGDKLNVSRSASQDGLIAVLSMAALRYGQTLTVNGTAEFKEQVAQAAAAANLTVRFADPETEKRRLVHLAANRADRLSANRPRGIHR
ncbi:MAG: TraI/MobA(P) family conjugative relaxase [Pseudomonadota bacterium]|jgi:hypothetical protein